MDGELNVLRCGWWEEFSLGFLGCSSMMRCCNVAAENAGGDKALCSSKYYTKKELARNTSNVECFFSFIFMKPLGLGQSLWILGWKRRRQPVIVWGTVCVYSRVLLCMESLASNGTKYHAYLPLPIYIYI